MKSILISTSLAASLCACAASPSETSDATPVDAATTTSPLDPASLAPGSEAISFFLGDWDVDVLDGNGNVLYRARTEARAVLDGHAIQDDWRALGADGSVIFRGTSLRCFIPTTGRFAIHWVMADHPGYTYLDADWVDGELRGEGQGVDGNGAFLERLRYVDITGTSYRFEMERSYDAGETWRPTSLLRARKRV